MSKQLISPFEILSAVSKQRPHSHLKEISQLFGEDKAALLMLKMNGKSLHFPQLSTLNRIAKAEYIKKELRYLRRDNIDFNKKVKKLARMLKMSKPAVIRTLERGSYSE